MRVDARRGVGNDGTRGDFACAVAAENAGGVFAVRAGLDGHDGFAALEGFFVKEGFWFPNYDEINPHEKSKA